MRRITNTLVLLLLVWRSAAAGENQPLVGQQPSLHLMTTESGVEFGVRGAKPFSNAPTLVVLASTVEGTLGDKYFRQCGNELAAEGFLCVSIDLPCHGSQRRTGEPPEFEGWGIRAANNENFVAENNDRLSAVLDHMIDAGFTDPKRIAACGTSRGAFMALHFAAHDPRVRCTAAFAPVTDLTILSELQGMKENPLISSLNLVKHADALAGRPVWIVIGDQDERVGTDSAIACARAITAAAVKKNVPNLVELHVVPEPRGHTTPPGVTELAANWIRAQID